MFNFSSLDIFQKINNGEKFEDLAKEFSDDLSNKEKGGDLGFFQRRRMVQEFDEAAFNLNVGEVSDIVKTRFGYHLIRVVDEKEYPTED